MGSRWLDPSEVAKGPEMRQCGAGSKGPGVCCKYPAQSPSGYYCASCACGTAISYFWPAILPPSPLIATQIRTGITPRIKSLHAYTTPTSIGWTQGDFRSTPKAFRVRKVRDWHEPVAGCLSCDGYAKWVLA